MERSKRGIIYFIVFVAVAGIVLTGPSVWATPGQSPDNQTVPTKTPKPPPRPEATDSDPEKPSPEQTPETGVTPPPGATVAPVASVVPVAPIAPAQVGGLLLEKQADRALVWPGVTVGYTLTLTNPGTTSVQRITIADALPPGLEPGAILAGSGAAWDGRTLRAQVAVLPPGGEYTVAFSALAGSVPGLPPDLINRATASTAKGVVAQAQSVLAWPPLELPQVGVAQDDAGRH